MRISYWKHIEITVHVVKRKRILEGQVPIRKMCWQRWRSRPLSFSLLIWPTLACKSYLIIPQWSRLRSGSQILDFNFRFCDNYACICFFHRLVVFHRNRHEQPGNFRSANIFQVWIAMGNHSDDKLEWNGENYTVLRFLVPALQHVEICWEKHTFVLLENWIGGGGSSINTSAANRQQVIF